MTIELWIEMIGAVIGLIYLYLEYKASFWLWTAGIIMSLFYIFIFYHSKFYADAGIYLYYLIANVYGLILWQKHRHNKTTDLPKEMPVTHIIPKTILPLSLIGGALFILLYFILHNMTDSPVPMGDSFTTALSIVAMYLLAKKKVEHWILWTIINFTSAFLYVWKGLYPTSLLFFIYGIVSILGYFRWKRQM